MAKPTNIENLENLPERVLKYFEVNIKKHGRITEPDLPDGMQDFGVIYNKNRNKAMVVFVDPEDETKMDSVKAMYKELNQSAYDGKINSADYRG